MYFPLNCTASPQPRCALLDGSQHFCVCFSSYPGLATLLLAPMFSHQRAGLDAPNSSSIRSYSQRHILSVTESCHLFPSGSPLLSSSPGLTQPFTTALCLLAGFHIALLLFHRDLPLVHKSPNALLPLLRNLLCALKPHSPASPGPTASSLSSLPLAHHVLMEGWLQPGWTLCTFVLGVPIRNILHPPSPFMTYLKPPPCWPLQAMLLFPLLWPHLGLRILAQHSSPAYPPFETHCTCSDLCPPGYTYLVLAVTNVCLGPLSYRLCPKQSSRDPWIRLQRGRPPA